MSAFDPYHKWLGIPPAEQPPHHYRLLGVAPFEATEIRDCLSVGLVVGSTQVTVILNGWKGTTSGLQLVDVKMVPASAGGEALWKIIAPLKILEATYGSDDRKIDLTPRMQTGAEGGLLVTTCSNRRTKRTAGAPGLSLKWSVMPVLS